MRCSSARLPFLPSWLKRATQNVRSSFRLDSSFLVLLMTVTDLLSVLTRLPTVRILDEQVAAVSALSTELRAAAAAGERTADLPSGTSRELAVLSLASRIEQRRNLATALDHRCSPSVSDELRVELPRDALAAASLGRVVWK